MTKKDPRKDMEEANQRWEALLREAQNSPLGKQPKAEEVVEITIAEVLSIGHYLMRPPEVAVIQDTEGRVWLIPETQGKDGDFDGLVSRYNVEPGMRLRLKIKKQIIYETAAFALTPEALPH